MSNPYNYHVAVRDDAMFFGRQDTLDRLVSGLSDPLPHSAALFGGRRCGKTSLLSKLRRVLDAQPLAAGKALAAGARRFVPCSLDLQRGRPLTCSHDFFLWVLEELGETWEQTHRLERGLVVEGLQTRYRDGINKGPVDAFVYAFRSLDLQGERIRLVILIDESEHILTVEWGDDLRPNLRALLSNSPIVEDVALVLAGSTQMYTKVTERDSPLENILDRYMLPALSEQATLELARRPNAERLSLPAAQEVWRQAGGQPCVAQYILHEAWSMFDGALEDAGAADIQDIAETFDEQTRHFADWVKTLGPLGASVYRWLAAQDAPAPYTALRQQFDHETSVELQSALDALVYHGLVWQIGRGRQQRFQTAGRAFGDWFAANCPAGAPTATPCSDEVASLQRQIGKLEANLRAIQERRTDFVDPRVAPLDWEGAERLTREEIGRVRARLAELGVG